MTKNKLYNLIKTASEEFRTKAQKEIKTHDRIIRKKIAVNKSMILSGLQKITPKNSVLLKDNIIDHFNAINRLIPFCSSPKSFRSAWDLRSNIISPIDAEIITNEGGQFIPFNENERLFKYEQQGVIYDSNRRLIKTVRHSEGNYDDDLDVMGRFTYQPPENVSGMLTYRWMEYLSNHLEIPIVILAVMWFEYRMNESINHVFVTVPTKIISKSISNFGNTLPVFWLICSAILIFLTIIVYL